MSAPRYELEGCLLAGALTRASPSEQWRLQVAPLRAKAGSAGARLRAFRWRGGEWLSSQGLHVAWTGRLLTIDNERAFDDVAMGERIAEGYLRGANQLWARLEGEFALCIWDPREARLILGGDPLRSVPLYYSVATDGFHFGEHAGRVAREAGCLSTLNADWIRAYVSDFSPEPNATCLARVYRVPAGCYLNYRDGNVTISRYWRPGPLEVRAPDALISEFRETLFDRVRPVINESSMPSIALSGGVDSSSLFRVAHSIAPGKTRAFMNRIPNDIASDELRYAQAAVGGTGVPLEIEYPSLHVDVSAIAAEATEPQSVEWYPFVGATALRARREGCDVMMTGAGGDTVGGTSAGWPFEYLRKHQFHLLYRQLTGEGKLAARNALLSIGRMWLIHDWPAAASLWQRVRSARVARNVSRPIFGDREAQSRALEKVQMWAHGRLPSEYQLAWYVLEGISDFNALARLFERMADLSVVHPFCAPRLVQVCTSLPWSLRHAGGLNRILMRRALADLLPDEIRLRGSKCHFGTFFGAYFERCLETESFAEAGVATAGAMGLDWASLVEGAGIGDFAARRRLFRLALVGRWLRVQQQYC